MDGALRPCMYFSFLFYFYFLTYFSCSMEKWQWLGCHVIVHHRRTHPRNTCHTDFHPSGYHYFDKWQLGARDAYASRAMGMFLTLYLLCLRPFFRCYWIISINYDTTTPSRLQTRRGGGFILFFVGSGTVSATLKLTCHHHHSSLRRVDAQLPCHHMIGLPHSRGIYCYLWGTEVFLSLL